MGELEKWKFGVASGSGPVWARKARGANLGFMVVRGEWGHILIPIIVPFRSKQDHKNSKIPEAEQCIFPNNPYVKKLYYIHIQLLWGNF